MVEKLEPWYPPMNGKPGKEDVRLTDVSDYVNTQEMVDHKNDPDFMQQVANGAWQWASTAAVQEKELARLPESYKDLENGHMGTHKFLIDDFCRAYATGKLSPTNIWQAARWNIPGLTAHKSALAGGEVMDVLDLGDSPADWEVLDWKTK